MGVGYTNRGLQKFCRRLHIFSSFGVELGLDKRSVDGFADGPTLGIKLGIGSTLDIKLSWTDIPGVGFKDGS
jgi:hypothetical protein